MRGSTGGALRAASKEAIGKQKLVPAGHFHASKAAQHALCKLALEKAETYSTPALYVRGGQSLHRLVRRQKGERKLEKKFNQRRKVRTLANTCHVTATGRNRKALRPAAANACLAPDLTQLPAGSKQKKARGTGFSRDALVEKRAACKRKRVELEGPEPPPKPLPKRKNGGRISAATARRHSNI